MVVVVMVLVLVLVLMLVVVLVLVSMLVGSWRVWRPGPAETEKGRVVAREKGPANVAESLREKDRQPHTVLADLDTPALPHLPHLPQLRADPSLSQAAPTTLLRPLPIPRTQVAAAFIASCAAPHELLHPLAVNCGLRLRTRL